MVQHPVYKALKRTIRKMGFNISRYSPLNDVWGSQKRLLYHIDKPIIFDVGANVGQTVDNYKRIFPSSTIYSFEPFPDSFVKLKAKAARWGDVFPHQLALSHKAATQDLYVNPHRPSTNSLLARPRVGRRYYPNDAELDQGAKVRTDTLDHFCEVHNIQGLDILKMDIQGGELLALHGATRLLQDFSISIIFCEVSFIAHYDKSPLFHDISYFLATKGYSLFNLYNLAVARNYQLRQGDALFISNKIRKTVVDTFPEEP